VVDCSLVAGTPVRDLLLCAKHLFVAAMLAGCGLTWLNEGGANRPRAVSARCPQRAISRPSGVAVAVGVACRRVASIARSMAALSIRIKRSRDQPPQRLMSVSPSALTFSR
jgi:hypothetical protein